MDSTKITKSQFKAMIKEAIAKEKGRLLSENKNWNLYYMIDEKLTEAAGILEELSASEPKSLQGDIAALWSKLDNLAIDVRNARQKSTDIANKGAPKIRR